MNDPRYPETQLFVIDRFTFYSANELEGKTLRRVLYVDPSKGKKGKGRKKSDFSGVADVKIDSAERVTYLLDAYRKRLSPTAAENEIVTLYKRILQQDPAAELWIEENSFGDILGVQFQEKLRKEGIDKVVHTLLHTEEKSARLDRLSVRIENKGTRFPAKWQQEDRRPEWFSEFEDYPGPYDDTIDAIESADSIGSRSVAAASGGKDPEGATSRDRMQADRESRWAARFRGLRRRAA
jgi:predicted phage terminase large subunit-like protein